MIPYPPRVSSVKNNQNCRVRLHPLHIEYNSIVQKWNNFFIPIPTFRQWLVMKSLGINFK